MKLSCKRVTLTDPCWGALKLSYEVTFRSLLVVTARMSLSSWRHSGVMCSPHRSQIFLRLDALIVGMWYDISVLLGSAIYCGRRGGDEGREHTQQLAWSLEKPHAQQSEAVEAMVRSKFRALVTRVKGVEQAFASVFPEAITIVGGLGANHGSLLPARRPPSFNDEFSRRMSQGCGYLVLTLSHLPAIAPALNAIT
jgi:hypothetical protein